MITKNNLLYFFGGHEGNLYVTNGSSAQFIRNCIPRSLMDRQQGSKETQNLLFFPNAMGVDNERLVFGVGSSSATLDPLGLYSYDLATGALNIENTISTGNDGSSARVQIGAVFVQSEDTTQMSWRDDNETDIYGIDRTAANSRYVGGIAFIETGMKRVSSENDKIDLNEFEIVLARELQTNQVIEIKWRRNFSDSFTSAGTMSRASDGAIARKTISYSIPNVDMIQFRIELTPGASTLNSPELIMVAIR